MSDEEDDNFNFGQREPPLLDYVKQILRNYTEGQLLKELTQNADDAGAGKVRFLFDSRQHGVDRLYRGYDIGDLSPYQGPALCAFNDATFRNSDWKSIQSLSRSGKKNDPTKVGRFGMGFVSVYHVTDMPSILSGNYIAFMDPSETLFKHEGRRQSGRQIHKGNYVLRDSRFVDQFLPYKNLFEDHTGLTEGDTFPGALFRFPLRNKPSDISDNVVDGDEIRRLFDLFIDDAKIILLFLKNISSVTVGERLSEREISMFSAKLSSETKDIVQKSRQGIVNSIKLSKQLNHDQSQPFSTIFPIDIEVVENLMMQEVKYQWLVSVYLGGSDIPTEMFTLATEYDRLPLVGVAMHKFSGYGTTLEGRTFCFLPLPTEENTSGLPVHVNADFGVSDDRRSIKWPALDRNDKISTWNKLLLEHLFPKAYVEVILQAIKMHRTGEVSVDCIYQTWPNMDVVKSPWKESFCPELFKILLNEKIFYSEIDNGKWVDIKTAIFDLMNISEETRKLVLKLMLNENVPIVSIKKHPHVMNAVQKYRNGHVTSITPKLVRDTLRKSNKSLGSLTRNEKLILLEYLLDDNDFEGLQGFKLLPLADGSFSKFTSEDTYVVYFTVPSGCSRDLLPGLDNKFIADDLQESVRTKIINGSQNTGIQQVRELKPKMISTLIKQALPRDWLTCQSVIWYPDKSDHPSRHWIETFWNFLQKVCKDRNCDIRDYEGITLVPTDYSENMGQIKLVQLKQKSHIVDISGQYISLDPKFKEMLPLLNLIPVNFLSVEFVTFPHEIWKMYFHHAVPNDILRIFIEAESCERLRDDVKNLSDDYIKLLRSFLKDVQITTNEEKKILNTIAIFRRATRVLGMSNNIFLQSAASGNEHRTVNKEDLPPDDNPTYETLLDISDNDSKILASKLCLQPCPLEEVMCQMIRGTVQENGNLTSLMVWIMDRWHTLQPVYQRNIISEIKDKPFIPVRNNFKRASECFDSSDELLTRFFSGNNDVFPMSPFDVNYRSILLEAGLKTRNELTEDDVKTCVKEIVSNVDVEKSYALLEILEENPRKFLKDINYFGSRQWVPVEKLIDSSIYPSDFPFFNTDYKLVSPKNAKSVSCAPLVGSTLPLVSSRYQNLSEIFEWTSILPADKIYKHLQNIVNFVLEQQQLGNHINTSNIENILHYVYRYMQNNLENFKPFTENDDSLVWTGQGFIAARKISLEKTRYSLEPYVYMLLPGFKEYMTLFMQFGAVKKYDDRSETLLLLFEEIKEYHETHRNVVTFERIDRDRELAIQITECIIDLYKENVQEDIRERISLPIAAPNEHGLQFALCDDVCFPNEEWLEWDEFDDIKLVHEKVPPKIYNRLGVLPLSQKISGAMSLLGFQQAGQKEDLTQKLRNILDSGYTEDSIANEMIQNADDAGATEVKFMVDMRTNNEFNSRLLDRGMKSWQGPALWVYNDAMFSDADFENITKIGGRTKEDKREMIGTFGLGFNSVYHITDVPSFLSRGLIGFLDPHTTFLDSQLKDKGNPGIRIDLNRNRRTLKRFENQFKPYQGIFDCDMFGTKEVNFNGTLFRLPLRSANIQSEISKKYFKEDDILRLMNNMNKISEKILLFTQHVTKISVYYLGTEQEARQAVQLFSVEKTPKQYIKDINKSLKNLQNTEEKFKIQNCILVEASKFVKADQLTEPTDSPSSLTKVNVEHRLTKGALRLCNTSQEYVRNVEWLVSSSTGQSKALNLYTSDPLKYKIPCGGIAIPVIASNLDQGEVFCFLPLSIPTSGIPCHVNGNFQVSNDRRSLWRRGTNNSEDIKSDWNDAMFADIITRSYVSLLGNQEAQLFLEPDMNYNNWPDESQIPNHSEFYHLLKEFYRAIAYGIDDNGDKPCVFHYNNKQLNIDSVAIYKPDDMKIADDVKNILQKFIPDGVHVVDVPDKVINGFKRADCGDCINERIYTEERFFKELFFTNIDRISEVTRNKLTIYVIDNYNKNHAYTHLLKNTACIPTDTSGHLKMITFVVHPHGKVADLFDPEENRFPTQIYQDEARLEIMVKLGMKKDDLDLSELLERARRLENNKHQRKHKITKIQCFMKFLETKRRQIDDAFIDNLLRMKIFPVLKTHPSESFPREFPWYGTECDDFLCAEQLYPTAYIATSGFVKPIIDEDVFKLCQDAQSLCRMLDLSKETRSLSCSDVIQQLKKLTQIQNSCLKKNESTVLQICKNIYSNLEANLDSISGISELRDGGWPWIWNGEGFSNVNTVCINKGTVDLSPYMFSVHASFRVHEQLFRYCNIPMEQSERLGDLVAILHKISEKHDGVVTRTEIERDRHLVIEILNYIKGHSKEDTAEYQQDILLPIRSSDKLLLVTPSECCFCDDWFKSSLDFEHDENLIHEDVTNMTAEYFGVMPLSRKLSHCQEIGITQCGQEEPLTQRLHNILQDYQATDIPKEMIQNADDAKATEIKFLIDLAENSDTKGLLDKGMSLCHGPALCVYNDAMFTEDDFKNITKLGGKTKANETEKIGKFGLGFNSVYHITDVPSFISNGRLTIFDPHKFHLGHQIKAGVPGIQINFRDNPQTLKTFSNQFLPYENVFGCDLHGRFTGTLFRLPLRTDIEVQKGGKITEQTFDERKITDLSKQLSEQAGEILLFTKHVQRMGIYVRNNYKEEPECMCSVEKELFKDSLNENSYEARINVEFPKDVSKERQQENWIIHTSQGYKEALQIASSPEGVKHGLNTFGGLACSYGSKQSTRGLVFCFLPLSIPSSNLPVHINAKFSVTPDRRSLRKTGIGDGTTIHSEWNEALMKDVIARGYIKLLSDQHTRTLFLKDVSNNMFSLWPRSDRVHTDFLPVVHGFYEAIIYGIRPETDLPKVFTANQNWYTFNDIRFLDSELSACRILPHVKIILNDNGFTVIDLPDYIKKSFIDSKFDGELIKSTISYREFFDVHFFPKLAQMPDDIANQVVLYLLQSNDQWIQEKMKCTPCIPSTPDGLRKRPDELIDQSCLIIASMYLPEDGKFPLGKDFQSEDISGKLRSLGMSHSEVPFKYIVERCKSIENLHHLSCSNESIAICEQRANAILKYIDSIKKFDEINEEIEEIRNIKFIPTKTEAPADYPIPWANLTAMFLPPKSVYISRLAECVGAVSHVAKTLSCSRYTMNILGMKKTPDLNDVINQLKCLVATKCTNIDSVQNMYKQLMNEINIRKNTEESTIRESLLNLEVIFCSGKFVKVEQVALGCKREFKPYLYKLPVELTIYVEVFKILGIKDDFSYSTLLDVSYLLQRNYGDNILKETDLQVIIDIVKCISRYESFEDERSVLAPDKQGRLKSVNQLSYCLHDCSNDDTEGEILCHDDIPHKVAADIGIKDIRTNVLMKHGMKLNISEQLGSKFGQVQKLTNRLSEILKEYPCDDSILKELLQNSDDAGADEINFIYDHRQHKDKTVFCESWKETLGPALCVYNNKTFTDDDLKGIQDLGIGSKSSNPDKTGQYGIGFNSVYHLTDCPSFLSNNDTLCILDPHCIFIDHATPDAPGYKYDIQPRLNKMFADALSCFRLDCLQNVGGTVFRFPLRTREMNNYTESKTKSVISEEIFDKLKIKTLLDTFKSNAFDMLLYLNNVKQIRISHIDDKNEITTDYWVKAELSPADELKRNEFHCYVKECAKKSKLKDMRHREVTYKIKIFDSRCKKQVWLVNQCIGSTREIPPSVATEYDEGHFKLLPRGGVAACLSHRLKNPSTYCFLPLPIQPKLPVSINGHFSLNHNRRDLSNITHSKNWNTYVMCEVIVPSYSRLLEHLRDKMFGSESGSISHITCNSEYLADLMNSYWHYFPKLENVHTEWTQLAMHVFLHIMHNRLKMFPVVRRTDNVISIISDKENKEMLIKWLPSRGTNGGKAYFCTDDIVPRPVLSEFLSSNASNEKMLLNRILQQIGFNISNVPPHIYNDLNEASLQSKLDEVTECHTQTVEKVSPLAVVQFLKTDFDPGTALPCHIERSRFQSILNYTTLLKYVDQDSHLRTNKIQLDGIPLLLTQDSNLRKFDRTSTYFNSKNHALLPQSLHEFVHENACRHFTEKSYQIKQFKINNLVERLQLNIETKFNTGYRIIWNPDDKVIPNKTWIKQLWTFLKDEFENQKDFSNYDADGRYNYIKERMGNWAVFPVNVTTHHGTEKQVSRYLMSFSSADTVLQSRIVDSQIKDALNKMALPVLDESVFQVKEHYFRLVSVVSTHSKISDFVTKFIATENAPQKILKSLVSLLDENSEAFNVLSCQDKKNFLFFFQRFIDHSLNKNHSNDLQRLPCYQSIYNEFICLNRNRQTFVLYSGIPEIEKEYWITSEVGFIKDDRSLNKLYTLLGLTKCTEFDVYKRFILPCFHKFSDKARIEHMAHIKSKLQYTDTTEKNFIIEYLKRTPLLAHPGKPLRLVSEYFDSSVEIFKKMLNPEEFLPEPFCQSNWRSLMLDLDLKTKASPEIVLEFAKTIERGMNLLDFKNQVENSKSLISHIAVNEDLRNNVYFLANLSVIGFLAPSHLDQDLLKLHSRYITPGRCGIAFEDAVINSNANLVWTSAHMLPSYATEITRGYRYTKRKIDILQTLRVHTTPQIEIVLNHTKALCTKLNSEDNHLKWAEARTLGLLRNVMRSIYEHFCKLCKSNKCEQIVRELKDVPIMLVGDTILTHAKNTVKTSKKGVVLTPYIYEIPEEFVQYMDLFTRLGAQSKPSILQCCELLKMIHEDIKDGFYHQNPNLVSAIKFAVRKIFKAYEDDGWLQGISVLYLPNRSSQLIDSSRLKYFDKPMFEVRMDLETRNDILFDFKKIKSLDNEATVYVEKMPTKLRPGKFSEDVKEIMSTNPIESKCPYAEEGLCQQLNDIKHKIHSTEFSQGIYRLLNHEANERNIPKPDFSNISRLSAKYLSIQCLSNLETHLVRSGKKIEGSVKEQCCFLAKQLDPVTLFIRHDDSENSKMLKLMLVNIIRELTGVSDRMTIAMIIYCNLSQIQTMLSNQNIQTLDSKTTENLSLPDLGSPVPDDIVALLDNDPYNEFMIGEYVVYELDDYGEEEYVYARIIDKIGPDNHSINCRYKINYGRGEKIVSSLDLYKWKPRLKKPHEWDLQAYVGDDHQEEYRREWLNTEEPVPPQESYDNLEETKNRLSDKLGEIWKLEENERKKAVKRLYLKWHPDKNPEHVEFCTEVFKHLKNEIDRLEKGKLRHESTWGAYSSNDFGTWEAPFRRWNRRAGRDRRRREYYRPRSTFNAGSDFSDGARFRTYSDFSFYTSPPPRPMPDQADLWQKQAHEDLCAARNDKTGYPSYEWVAYKCMQAAEKSLKAAILSSIGTYDKTHDIKYLSITVAGLPGCPNGLRRYVDQLCRHGINQVYCRYPREFDSEIPHNLYDRHDAVMCIDNAREILNMMDILIAYNR